MLVTRAPVPESSCSSSPNEDARAASGARTSCFHIENKRAQIENASKRGFVGSCITWTVDRRRLPFENGIVEGFNNSEAFMATVNFSVPEDVKERFNKAFEGQNKSQIIAELMDRAVEEQALRKRRVRAIEELLSRRSRRPSASTAKIRKVREAGRP